MTMNSTILSMAILAAGVALTAACVAANRPAVGNESGGQAERAIPGPSAPRRWPRAPPVTVGGSAQSECGFFADLASCSADDSTPDVVDQAGATAAIVGTWRRCDNTEPGFFDVGVRFQSDGRAYRLYRRPNEFGGSTADMVYCGSDMSDAGAWSVNDKSAEGLPDEYDLTIAWDNGDATTFDVELYGNRTALGLFDAPDATNPELFAPEGPAL